MGRLTRDPELRHTQSNLAVTSFTLAIDRSFQRAGEPRQTDFIDIVAWQKQAEFAAQYFKKGQLVAVSGRIQVRNWKDNAGNDRRTYEVVADELHFAESKRETSARGNDDYSTLPQGQAESFRPAPISDFAALSGSDDDLPF